MEKAVTQSNLGLLLQRLAIVGSLVLFSAAFVVDSPIVMLTIVVGQAGISIGLAAGRRWSVFSLTLISILFLLNAGLSPLRGWPTHFLVPLVLWWIVTRIPGLRASLPSAAVGRWDRGTAVLAMVTVVGSTGGLVLWYILAEPNLDDARAMMPQGPVSMLVLAGFGFAVINAVMEELLWRHVWWKALELATSRVGAINLLQAVSFGLAHIHGFPRGWSGVVLAAVYGVFLGWIRRRSAGLVPVIVVHIFADLVIFAVLAATMRR